MSKPTKPPELLKVGGQWYKLTLFRVVSRFEDGTPEECVLIPDWQTVELNQGDEFMTSYIPKVMFPAGDKP